MLHILVRRRDLERFDETAGSDLPRVASTSHVHTHRLGGGLLHMEKRGAPWETILEHQGENPEDGAPRGDHQTKDNPKLGVEGQLIGPSPELL